MIEGIKELAQYGTTGIALAAFVFAYLIFRDMLKTNKEIAKSNSEAFNTLKKSVYENTKHTKLACQSNKEIYEFLKNLNGELRKNIKAKIK